MIKIINTKTNNPESQSHGGPQPSTQTRPPTDISTNHVGTDEIGNTQTFTTNWNAPTPQPQPSENNPETQSQQQGNEFQSTPTSSNQPLEIEEPWVTRQATLTVYFDNARVPQEEPHPEGWKERMGWSVYESLYWQFAWNLGPYRDIVLHFFSYGTDEHGCITAPIPITFKVRASDICFVDQRFENTVLSELHRCRISWQSLQSKFDEEGHGHCAWNPNMIPTRMSVRLNTTPCNLPEHLFSGELGFRRSHVHRLNWESACLRQDLEPSGDAVPCDPSAPRYFIPPNVV